MKRGFRIEVDPETGDVMFVLIHDAERHTHTCIEFTGTEFDDLQELVTAAHLESKVARS